MLTNAIALILSVCLYENPQKCKEQEVTFSSESVATPFACMMGAPIEIAKWAEHNPRWFAKRWTCRIPGQMARI